MRTSILITFSGLLVHALLFGCTRNAFDDSKPLYAPIMLDDQTKTYAGCVKVYDQAETQSHIKKLRAEKKVIAETTQYLEIRSSPNEREKYFHNLKECETYLEDLQYKGWKNHSNAY